MSRITVARMQQYLHDDLAAMQAEQDAKQPASATLTKAGELTIDTRMSRNPRLASNGGDYDFWTRYWVANGRTYRIERASCDFWQPQDEEDYCDWKFDLDRYVKE